MPNYRVTPNAKQEVVDIAGGSTFGKYSKISAAKTFNMYLTDAGIEQESKEWWQINFPGYQRVLNLFDYPSPYPNPPIYPNQVPVGEGRGIFHSIRGNIVVTVVNSTVFALSTTLGKTVVGTLDTSIGEVFMDENLNNQIAIVDGLNVYIYNYTAPGSFTKQTDIGGPLDTKALVPSYVTYHHGFFLFGNAITATNSQSWYVYQYNSATTIAQLPAGTGSVFPMTTKPDFALAVKRIPARGSNIIVFGQTVSEIWTESGSISSYTLNPSLSVNYGCQSVSTIAEGADILVWLGINEDESPVICVHDGEKLTNISTDGIDFMLGNIVAPQASTAILYREDGHLFYILTFYDPRDNITIMYDFNTQLFSNLTDQYGNHHPARGMVYFNLHTYFISLNNAALYEIGSKYTTINENLPRTSATSAYDANLNFEINRMRITSNIRLANSGRFIVNSFVITLEQGCDENYKGPQDADYLITEDTFINPDDIIITEQGQSLITETSIDASVPYVPRIDLAFSKDGGVTWSNFDSRTLHPLGYRQNILQWEGQGAANDICWMLRYYTTGRILLNNAIVDIIP